MTHLLLFTVGPVQAFIAQARKTHDLYAGSQILSELVKAGITAFEKEFPTPTGKIIFPDPNNMDAASMPNRFIGKFMANVSDLKAKGEAIQRAVEEKWMQIAEKSLKKSGIEKYPDGFQEQIKGHLDVFWVFHEIKGDYATAYQELERLGGAVKNIRNFEQYRYNGLGERGRKCSLDGESNVLFYRKRYNSTTGRWELPVMVTHNKLDEMKSDLTDKFDNSEWSEGEALGAVGAVKRLYKRGDNRFSTYPSTTVIALQKQLGEHAPEAEKFKNIFGKENLGNLLKQFENLQIEFSDGDWAPWNDQYYYEENLTSNNIPNPSQMKLALEGHKTLKKSGFRQEKYYAVIRFDGDHMGKWLSGANNKSKNDLEEFHTTLSGALAKFGKEAKEYLDKSNGNGQTVYAGGDDFLGFVNIHHLFEVMKFFRRRFDEVVNTAIAEFKQSDKHLTFSAGIVIAHYKMPFSEVLKKARTVEKSAKNEGERNAFGIAVMKHSGEVQQAIYKWDTNGASASGISNWEALEVIYKVIDKEDGSFSNKFIQNLTAEIQGLTGVDMKNPAINRDGKLINIALPWEIKRLVNRAWKEGQQKDKEKAKLLAGTVTLLWNNVPKESAHRPRNFIHALHITDFITRKITQEQ